MTAFSRRSFIGSSMALPLLAAVPVRGDTRPVPPMGEASTIVRGARVLTMDPANPVAEAIAVRGEHLLAVGSNAAIGSFAGKGTQLIDARGCTVVPGFIDAHSHPLMANPATGVNVNFRSIAEVQAALAERAAETPAGHWVVGVMYDDTKFVEGRPLLRRDIDAVVPDHPVYVGHRGGHTAVVNSKAFEMAGITMATPDPEGGRYFRDGGELTGKVAENATLAFNSVGNWPVVDRATWRDAVAIRSREMAAAGLTSTTDAWCNRTSFVAFQDARAAGELHFRVSLMPFGGEPIYADFKASGIRSGFGDDMIRIGAVKYAADGSASERTMRMSTPYRGRPDDYGILTMSQQEIDAAVDDAVAHDFRIGIHANGDVAIDMVLKAYERVLGNWQGENPRFRIEHCSLINPSLLRRIKAAGVVPAPFYTYAYYHGNKWVDYGAAKMENMFAHRSFLDAGIPVAPASDFAPGPFEPMMAIQSMVTRKDVQGRVWGPSQRVSVTEAMRICTMNGAYASFEEHIKGSLTPGKLADFVILEKDPHDVDPDSIVDIGIVRTVLGGRTTYEA
jgi:predicted amidohydrolase YtcJ